MSGVGERPVVDALPAVSGRVLLGLHATESVEAAVGYEKLIFINVVVE